MHERIILFLAGLCFGSFANVCIFRLPEDQSLIRPRSKCPRCHHPIAWFDNIPVVSFCLLRARCRACRAPLSWQYPLVELGMGLCFAGAYGWHSGDIIQLILLLSLIFFWITTTIIDIRHRILPDELTLGLLVLGWGIAWWNTLLGDSGTQRLIHSFGASLGSGAAMLLMAWLGEKAFKKEALGGGDVKLMAACGAALGINGVVSTLFIGSLTGGIFGLLMLALGQKKMGETIPFGPFLNVGMAAGFFFPEAWKPLFGLLP